MNFLNLWDKFFASGKISDYINYAAAKAEKGGADIDNPKGTDTQREEYR